MDNPSIIPWQIKNFVSNNFPGIYYYIINVCVKGNSPEHWNQRLEELWNDESRHWPTKVKLIKNITKANECIVDIGRGNGSIYAI